MGNCITPNPKGEESRMADIDEYRYILTSTGLIPKNAIHTLKFSVYHEKCQWCDQRLRLAWLAGCNHQICVACLDAIVDSKRLYYTSETCPICSTPITDFVYLKE